MTASDPEKLAINLTDEPFPDKKHEDFFKWVGVCIKEWANIEKGLFDLCSLILGAEHIGRVVICEGLDAYETTSRGTYGRPRSA